MAVSQFGQGAMQQRSVSSRVHEALDGIVFRTVLSFVAVAVVTSVPLVMHLQPTVHAAAHAVLPAGWTLYALAIWLHERGRPVIANDPWRASREIDPGGARAARIAAVGLPIGWIAAAIGLLVHHLGTTGGAVEVLGIDLPMLAVGWFLACWAWWASTRRALAETLTGSTADSGADNLRAARH